MDFFGIGSGELLLILILGLVLFGPGKIVEVGRSLGKMVHEFRKATSDLSSQITREIDAQKKESAAPPGDSKKQASGS